MNGGHGTLSPSYAIERFFKSKGHNAKVIDIMSEANPLGEILGNVYNYFLRHSLFSAAVYMQFSHMFPIDKFKPFNAIGRKKTAMCIDCEQPDAIVLICPWISRMIIDAIKSSGLKKVKKPLVFIDVVDLGQDMSTSWINNDADFTFLPTINAKQYLSRNGLNLNKADVLGIPLDECFAAGPVSLKERKKARAKYKLENDTEIVTILGGREGVKNTANILIHLMKEFKNVEFMVQCGLNRSLFKKIDIRTKGRKNVHLIRFVDSMRDIYSLSDVVITKPGALTVSELIVSQIPFVLDTYPIVMPQELGNVKFVLDNDLGFVANNIQELSEQANKILSGNVDQFVTQKNEKLRTDLYGTDKICDHIMSELSK